MTPHKHATNRRWRQQSYNSVRWQRAFFSGESVSKDEKQTEGFVFERLNTSIMISRYITAITINASW